MEDPWKSSFAPGRLVGRYELAVLVREDDAGSTWLAREKTKAGTDRLVALRAPLPTLAGDERFRALLRQEVKLASGVAHPNVAQVLELSDSAVAGGATATPREGRFGLHQGDDALFVASEWVDGETFADLRAAAKAKKVRIPHAIALRILADACAGLHAAHLLRDRSGGLLNVVHGDVSPKSIVIAGSGEARVIDLGFMKARARHAGGANHAWSLEGGVPPGQRIDRHSDVWGIGAILAQVLADPIEGGPAQHSALAAAPLVSELVVRARSLDPLERFATAAEMQGAIEAAMMTLGIATSHATVGAFARGLVGDRTLARAEALRASRARAPVTLSVPTPAVESVPATVQSVRGERVPGESRVASAPPLPRVVAPGETGPPPALVVRESRSNTGSAISHTPARGNPAQGGSAARRGKKALLVGGLALGVLGVGASAYRATRPPSRVAMAIPPDPVVPPAVPAASPPCPAGMVAIAAAEGPTPSPLAPFCLDTAPVTTEAYKACSDEGDCKRAATENRWAGITAKDQAADDPLCRERDPRAHAKEPVNCVDRDMAAVYCKAHGLRLPTQAEAAFVTESADGRPGARSARGFSEWSQRPDEPPTNRSYAIGFRCARSL